MEDRVCRVCLAAETTKDFSRIFDGSLALKIFLLTNVKIIELNSIPALICKSCELELYQCFNFRRKVQSSQEYFNNQLYESELNLWNECEYIDESFEKEKDDTFSADKEFSEEYQIEEASILVPELDVKEETTEIEEGNEIVKLQESTKERTKRTVRAQSNLRCQYCNMKLSRRQRLIQHERLHFIDSTKNFYTCDLCGKMMNQRFGLIPHFQKKHDYVLGPKERWKCAICINKTLPACKMEVHYRRSHNEFYHETESKINTIVAEIEPLNTVERNKKSSKKPSRQPKPTKQAKTFFFCSLCGNNFINSYRYQKHLKVSHGVTEQEILQNEGTIEILNDSIDVTHKTVGSNHHQESKKSTKVPCSSCGKIFSSITTCKAHEKTHLDNKFICDLCGSQFKVKSYLTSHVQKVHLKLKRFKCSLCTAAFVHRELLNYHVKKHLNIRNYSCQYCQKTFVRKACALIHERIHTNERKFSCKYCHRQFIHQSDHRRHELRHLNDNSHKRK